MKHLLNNNIAQSSHHISIHLIGVGGTGSHVLTNLAMMNHAMIKTERQPIHVTAIDMDDVSESNIGRQGFAPPDIGENKARVLTTRVNRHFGFQWDSYWDRYETFTSGPNLKPDIIISCVDSVKSRKEVHQVYVDRASALYWMDIGNEARKAQIILGSTHRNKEKRRGSREFLPNFFDEFPGVKDDPNDNTPSCSAMASLNRQDLFINKIVASYATHMLWTLLKDYMIDYRGMYINLETLQVNKIPIL